MRVLTYNQFGDNKGRLGNQLFEIASLFGMANKYRRELRLPMWDYQKYFKHNIPRIGRGDYSMDVQEKVFHFPGWEYWGREFGKRALDRVVSVDGWLQSSQYWKHCEKELREFLQFKEEYIEPIKEKWKDVLSKPCIMVGIRVGQDYVENGNYEILPILYQVSALWEHFPNWREEYNIIVFSDDFQYAKLNFDCDGERIFFAEGMSDIEQMMLGSLCTHFIIPNSSFSWWQAYLGEKNSSIVIRPSKYFKAYLETVCETRDLWEEHWRIHDYRGKKLDMKDITFHIPVKFDHKDRMENMQMVEEWLWRHFDTNVVVGEQDGEVFKDGSYLWVGFPTGENGAFHRTRMLNVMAWEYSSTPYIINFDCDNIVAIMQMAIGLDILRREEADMVYPYNGKVARVDREKWRRKLIQGGVDCGVFRGVIFPGTKNIDPISVGHIIMWNHEKFLLIGGENEYFISYGPEDVERYERARKFDLIIARVEGCVYHMEHWRGADSSGGNRYFNRNYQELDRLRKLNREELWNEVENW